MYVRAAARTDEFEEHCTDPRINLRTHSLALRTALPSTIPRPVLSISKLPDEFWSFRVVVVAVANFRAAHATELAAVEPANHCEMVRTGVAKEEVARPRTASQR